ncbi:hypothetical protein ACUNWD_03600 [Sunxiuqinia sp. A32]|uniref:hypothetical protein n=1 Tax=Sunxiuqinia sp. A32 TaxID=3461496 RepID=UPI004045AB3A
MYQSNSLPYISQKGRPNQRIHLCEVNEEERDISFRIKYSEGVKMPDELVKFYQISTYNVDALLNSYLWASRFDKFNDPFDCPPQLWNIDSFAKENIESIVNPDFRQIFHHFVDKKHNWDLFMSYYLPSFLGIVCLNNPKDVILDTLWGYYSNQEGYALKFDCQSLRNNLGDPFEIEYLEEEDLDFFSLDDIKETKDLYVRFLRWSTQKKKIWKHESEWRYIFSLKADILSGDAYPEERVKKFHPSAIKEVILGLRFFDKENAYQISDNEILYIIDGSNEKQILQDQMMSFLSFPNRISVSHVWMKNSSLQLYSRNCQIFKESERRYRIVYE